jgi:hypothetical protein
MVSRVILVLFVGFLAHVQGAPVDKVFFQTNAAANSCSEANQLCDGGFEREMDKTNPATNVIPQEASVKLKYDGSLLAARYLSIVDKTLNNNNPCADAYAMAAADTTHSGKMLGTADKVVTVMSSILLDASKDYAVCYSAAADGNSGWQDTDIRLRVSKISYIKAYGRKFKTKGTIPHHESLTMYYSGTVLEGRWISFVASTLNNNDPCAKGFVAAAPRDSLHSGSMAATAGTRTFVADTAALSGTTLFAVCYAESGGITSSQWRDSGIRIRRSKIKKVWYGVETAKFGEGSARATYNRNPDDPNGIATDMFPQIASAQLKYEGELQENMKISLVDASLQDEAGDGGNPCGYPKWAAKAANAGTPGATQTDERAFSGKVDAVGKIATIPQGSGNLLNAGTEASPKIYAVCYAEGDGSDSDDTWADSYARFKISKVEALGHHNMLHTTNGILPKTTRAGGSAVAAEKLLLGYTGSLAVGANTIKFTLVHANTNAVTANGITIFEPCKLKSNAETAAGATASGVLATENGKKIVPISTADLNSGTITGNTLTTYEFAVCYTDSTDYRDSGIRLTVGKVTLIEHGRAASGVHGPRVMRPLWNTGAALPTNWVSEWVPAGQENKYTGVSPGLASARNVLPQVANQVITFDSEANMNSTESNKRFVSLVDASINGRKPCALATEAAHLADTTHSGAILATHYSVTIPQDPLLDVTKVYAVCYAITSGTQQDVTWADSYVRVTISAIQSITSLGVTHSVSKYDGQIASRATTVQNEAGGNAGVNQDTSTVNRVSGVDTPHSNKLDLTYSGSLEESSQVALVDETTNAMFPCATLYVMGSQTASSGPTAAPGTAFTGAATATVKTVLMTTQSLEYSGKIYAACFKKGTHWHDSGIRLTRSPIYSMRFYDSYTGARSWRDQTSVFLSTNRIPQAADQVLEYIDNNQGTGELDNGRWVALVAADLAGGDPCVVEAQTEATADHAHSGAVKASDLQGGAGKKVKIPQVSLLDASKTFAVCYSTSAAVSVGTSSDGTSWYDSYVRLKLSQIENLSIHLGKWKGSCAAGQAGCVQANTISGMPQKTGYTIGGLRQTYVTYGQLPQMMASDTGLEITYAGSLSAHGYISLVDAFDTSMTTTTHGIKYQNPCEDSANAAKASDSTHSGPIKGDTVGFCQGVIDPGTRGNFCDTKGDGAFTQACEVGARCKANQGTNGGCGSQARCTGSQITTLKSTDLDKTKTYALCYTETHGANGQPAPTDTPLGTSASVWADSGIRLTISKIRSLLTSSRHKGISARIQTSVFKPTNRIPAKANQKLTYVGELAVTKYISLASVTAASADDQNPCISRAAAAKSADTSGAIVAATGKKNVHCAPRHRCPGQEQIVCGLLCGGFFSQFRVVDGFRHSSGGFTD